MIKRTTPALLWLIQLFLFCGSALYSQNQQKRDSLFKVIASTSGIEKAKGLNQLTEMLLRNAPDSSFQFASQSIVILQKIKTNDEVKKELARAITYRSIIYSDKADYEMALKGLLEALKLNEETGEKKQIANSLNSIGRVYYGLQNTDMAMKYFGRREFARLRGEEIKEQIMAELDANKDIVSDLAKLQKN